MVGRLVLGVVLLLAGRDPQLVGTWGLEGEAFVRFDANGKGEMGGEPFTWSTDGGTLTITADGESERVGYGVQSGQLALSMGGIPLTFQRIGGKGAAAASPAGPQDGAVPGGSFGSALGGPMGGAPAKKPPAEKAGGSDDLAKLLVSSAWCSFKFNKTTGYSSTERYQFFANGTFSLGGRAEGYSSGYGGSMASQHDSGSTGQWKTQGGKLFLSAKETNGQFTQVPLTVTRNSNGAPILESNGQEYSKCQ